MFSIARRQALFARQNVIASRTVVNSSRCLHQTATRSYPRKDAQDKDSIKAEPTEYSKSGSDYAAASEEAAFSADKTRPEEQRAAESKESPAALDNSPANTHLGDSKSKKDDAGASPSESKSSQGSRARSSGGGSPNKQGSGPAA
ncbi:hypothetical protein AMS68_006950 [Peltaster fructicola]|uniref:Uncharacterized protein n=1 Tax=Peltaster fructicola TaxID=286661 RepID=A0A6H0Y345_9PEZI|nr:hypothetical protein AMS68_006950 [Peltaster fructicola]